MINYYYYYYILTHSILYVYMIVAVVLCAAPAWLSQVVTYGTLLNVCRGHWEVALQLLRDMHRQKIVPWTSSGDVLD